MGDGGLVRLDSMLRMCQCYVGVSLCVNDVCVNASYVSMIHMRQC